MTDGMLFTGKTVEDAVADGLRSLGLAQEQVEIEVITRGSRGLFGIGSEPAQVRLTPRAAKSADAAAGGSRRQPRSRAARGSRAAKDSRQQTSSNNHGQQNRLHRQPRWRLRRPQRHCHRRHLQRRRQHRRQRSRHLLQLLPVRPPQEAALRTNL
jgi:predicted RNA-binding protein Jag